MKPVALVFAALLAACATTKELQNAPQPNTFTQGLAVAQGQIKNLRDITDFFIKAKGEDCKKNGYTDLCTAARQINAETRKYRDMLDQVNNAYAAAGGVLTKCTIEYAGVTLPCQDSEDQILAGLIALNKLLPQGAK